MDNKNTSNDMANQLDKLRKESLAAAVKGSRPAENKQEPAPANPDAPANTEPNENNQVNDEKKLDINDLSSYIKDENLKKTFVETFKGDINEVISSYNNSQSEYMKLRNQSTAALDRIQKLQEILTKNPELDTLLEKAEKGEDIKSFLNTGKEPQGKPDTPVNDTSKLSTSTEKVSEEDLIKAGLIDERFLEDLTTNEREVVIRRARIQYLEDVLPAKIAEKSADIVRKQIAEENKQRSQEEEQKQNKQLTSERYTNGIVNVVKKYELDFDANPEHNNLLSEINSFVASIRDPKNPNVIHEDAVEIATERLLKSKGLYKEPEPKPTDTTKDKLNFNSTSAQPNRQPTEPRTETLAQKMNRLHYEKFKRTTENYMPRKSNNN